MKNKEIFDGKRNLLRRFNRVLSCISYDFMSFLPINNKFMKFKLKFLFKKQTVLYTKRYFEVPVMNLKRAEILYHPDEVKDDNDVLYLIMKQILMNYNVKLLPEHIKLLN